MLDTDPQIEAYCLSHSTPLPDTLHELDRETHLRTTMPRMLSGPMQGGFLRMLTAMTAASYVVEVGTFTGYAACCMALGLPPGGRLISVEVDDELRTFHDKYIGKAGLEERISVRYGNALDILPGLEDGIDLAFIDADKVNYSRYYDILLPKLRRGGLIVADNVLWSGKVIGESSDKDTRALQAFSDKVRDDPSVENFLLPLRDGLMICRKL